MPDWARPEPNMDELKQRVEQLLAEGSQDIFRQALEPLEKAVVAQVVAHTKGNYVRASAAGHQSYDVAKEAGRGSPLGKEKEHQCCWSRTS